MKIDKVLVRVNKLYNMLKDADKPLYEGCTKHMKFSAIVHLWNMKCLDK